jgi:hypothetical protein
MTTKTRQRSDLRRTGVALLALAATVALLGLGAGTAAAAPVSTDQVTGTCWKDVVNDWLQHQPNVVGTYPISCYTQAIQHLNAYVDIQQYSSAPDDIHRALLAALRNNRSDGPGSGGGSSSSGPSAPSGGGSSSGGGGSSSSGGGSTPAPSKSFVTKVFDSVGPGDAQSIPLPLLVLAGLAVLLLVAAVGTWLAKRLQGRPEPAAAPARSPAPRRD